MKIKIAHVAGGLTTGGVEAVIYNYFSHMNLEDYELYYISYDTPNEAVQKKFEAIGFHVYEVCKKKENFFKSCKQVLDILKENEIQVIHSHMTLMSFITSVLAKMKGIKVCIAHSHLAQHITGPKKYIYAMFKWLSKSTSTHYFACGQEAAVYLYGSKVVEKNKVFLMHNAIDTKKFAFNEALRVEMREELALEDCFCIGHLGRFTEQKNPLFLIDVFHEVAQKRLDAVLVLLGEGPLLEETKAKVKAYNLEEKVKFVGSVTNPDKYYQAMDVFFLPSLYEGLAVSLVEAQCNGLPVVTSDKVTKEICLSNQYKVVPLSADAKVWADEICCFADVQDMNARKNAYRMVEDAGYSIEKEAEQLDKFYKQVVKS